VAQRFLSLFSAKTFVDVEKLALDCEAGLGIWGRKSGGMVFRSWGMKLLIIQKEESLNELV
jgi:hypothetical protein